MTTEISFVDTTLRDGVQSLWASRIRAREFLPVLRDVDAAGYAGIELIAPVSFARSVRTLREDPWDLPRAVHALPPKSAFRIHGSAAPLFGHMPRVLRELTLERLASYGLQITRGANPWNDYTALGRDQELLDRFGIRMVMDLVYSVSPRHTDEYFAAKARELARMRPYRACFKDVGGLLTPERVRALVPLIIANLDGVELEFHAHSNNGLAPRCVLDAVDCGIRIVHVATPPLASGYGQPSVFGVVDNLRARGYTPAIDITPVKRVAAHFGRVAKIEHLPVGMPLEYDEKIYRHQVPGGMVMNLEFQVAQLGIGGQLEAMLDEVEQVRTDLGYPIMITPLSQFVATQAVLNVLHGRRYEVVSDEVIQYALGRWGAEAVEVMDADIRARVLNRPRAQELSNEVRHEPTLEELRSEFGPGLSDEELILRVYVGSEAEGVASMATRSTPSTYEEYVSATAPAATLVRRIAAVAGRSSGLHVAWRTGDQEVEIVCDGGKGEFDS